MIDSRKLIVPIVNELFEIRNRRKHPPPQKLDTKRKLKNTDG